MPTRRRPDKPAQTALWGRMPPKAKMMLLEHLFYGRYKILYEVGTNEACIDAIIDCRQDIDSLDFLYKWIKMNRSSTKMCCFDHFLEVFMKDRGRPPLSIAAM